MIIVRLMGGLGNQMFQYAFGRQLAIQNKTRLLLDLTYLNLASHNITKRGYSLSHYNIDAEIVDNHQLRHFSNEGSTISRILKKLNRALGNNNIIVEDNSNEFYKVLQKLKDTYYIGYWQSEKYFFRIKGLIINELSLKNHLKEELYNSENIKGIIENIVTSISVSIHFRRGDYVTDLKTFAYHGICDFDYYYRAIKIIKLYESQINLFIFSDEPEWVIANSNFDDPYYIIEDLPDYIHMHLMSLCKHNIIANSSFSWWGAWLNQNPNKIVIAPKKWYNDHSVNTNSLIPDGWIKV